MLYYIKILYYHIHSHQFLTFATCWFVNHNRASHQQLTSLLMGVFMLFGGEVWTDRTTGFGNLELFNSIWAFLKP